MELMACGALVVTNENRYTRWLLENERNCLLSETSPGAPAEVIERGLRDHDLRRNVARQAAEGIRTQLSGWAAQTEKIYQYIVSQVCCAFPAFF
jgi:O-antigen biosynthesis protein